MYHKVRAHTSLVTQIALASLRINLCVVSDATCLAHSHGVDLNTIVAFMSVEGPEWHAAIAIASFSRVIVTWMSFEGPDSARHLATMACFTMMHRGSAWAVRCNTRAVRPDIVL